MCGRYAATLPPDMLVELFKVLNRLDFPPRYNIAPTQPVVAVLEEHGRRVMKLVRWGFVPAWVKDPRAFPLLINARAETMADKPAFRDATKHGRCILPASGYFEWRTEPGGARQPYYVTMADGGPMALAGLSATWVGPEGEEVDTVATITVPANPELAVIHDRMPVILPSAAAEDWLNVRDVRADEALRLAQPLPPGAVKFHPVSTRVGSAVFDDSDLILPVTPERPSPQPPRAKKAASGGIQLDLF
jgi:putative SOS response-associated peptidase YedK